MSFREMERASPLLLLVFSHLVFFSVAVPSTRIQGLMQENQIPPDVSQTQQVVTEETILEELKGRMEMEINDYPGSGANNRHIPRPPGRK